MQDIELTSMPALFREAEAEKDCRFDDEPTSAHADNYPKHLMVLVVNREDVVYDRYHQKVTVKPNVQCYAAAAATGNDEYGDTINDRQPLMPNRLNYQILLLFKMLIGSIGIYPFKKIWIRTVPKSWRTEDISTEPGYNK